MATVKVSGPDAEKKLTPAEAKMVLDAKIRQRFRWAVRSLVGDDGNQMQSFDDGAFERIVADIHDDIVGEMRYSDDIRQAIRDGVKNFNSAYIRGVLKKAVKGKAVPDPGIIMSAARAVAEVAEQEGGQLTERLAKLGTGARFKTLAKEVGSKPLAAWIGRKKYGKERFQEMSRKGKKRSRKGKKRGSR
jgi:hypothetical protein